MPVDSTIARPAWRAVGGCTKRRTWYKGCDVSDAEDIVQHILGGERVERLAQGIDPALHDLILEILDSGLE